MSPHIVLLQDYDRHDRVWALDLRSGEVSPASGRCHGFVRLQMPQHPGPARENREAAALFAEAGTLWFQYSDRRWDCASVTVRHSGSPDGTRRFTVTGPHGIALDLLYTAPVPEPFDASYDAIDALEDDFLHWVAQRLATAGRRHNLLAHYLNGFLPA
ncbi:hypothetical protein OIE62_37045 [Streptomyces scopuliridis]|uniref:Uncharacterized protein n=1 Tax=Streptomyces scopuliridis TaxID=452529 RepID=A0ACD4ZCR7_9ACTN|nr:hypothetical protein [Streptomyces scopuliridis]WSB31959.1 hypothetical protein OG949_03170 [Streptomyces scopuliridis]WSB96219.1 hypothetical protein OG835_03880 [Streptomyces scopuliridis]WSC10075.1 hypothetical protein OIE62_37045 [Streptomyces scopuliridis]